MLKKNQLILIYVFKAYWRWLTTYKYIIIGPVLKATAKPFTDGATGLLSSYTYRAKSGQICRKQEFSVQFPTKILQSELCYAQKYYKVYMLKFCITI